MEPDHPQQPGGLRFGILGPLTASADGRPLPLGPHKQRTVLGLLLCHGNSVVPLDLLADAVWAARPPRTARKNLQVYVWALRKLLATAGYGDRLDHEHGGYRLRVAPGELDALRFAELARAGRQAARDRRGGAAGLLREALDLWRGPLLTDLAGPDAIRAEAERLGLHRLSVYEDWAEAELDLGNPAAVAETVGELVREHPFRERLRVSQMTALHRCGRLSEALAVYDEYRRLLARELGLRPSPALEAGYRSLLEDRPVLRAAASPALPRADPAGAALPRDLADFTGRSEHLRELLGVLGRGAEQPVALTGPSGAGKSALALHVAHRLRDAFPDGRLLVRLREADGRPRPAGAVLRELYRAAGLPARPAVGDDPAEAAAEWRARLAGRRVLLLLDDAPDEASVRSLLPASGPAQVLVTSPHRLAGLESAYRVEVGPYPPGEALELLSRIVGPARVAADRPAAERIVAAAGLLPLAVRVAGTKLAVLRHLPLHEYAARLADPLTALDELSAGDTAVRPCLARCWQDLSTAARDTLRTLGTLPGPLFTLAEADAALRLGPHRTRRALESLIESCVVASPTSEVTAHAVLYELPRLLHLYAREQPPATPAVTSPGTASITISSHLSPSQ
ncbi:BTAD domain-containing putative transcriptional regulator [Streptomyces sp. NPDC092296]|uniref:AfsR/SARP family transcriptional regulator n=1 Tax=Streptomyces sp. NPDC092296 TaxID=3366012 RepID=UPI00382B4FF1